MYKYADIYSYFNLFHADFNIDKFNVWYSQIY